MNGQMKLDQEKVSFRPDKQDWLWQVMSSDTLKTRLVVAAFTLTITTITSGSWLWGTLHLLLLTLTFLGSSLFLSLCGLSGFVKK